MTDKEVERAAEVGLQEAVRGSTVGVVTGSGSQRWTGIGTGTLIKWRGHHLVLTAGHVIDDTAVRDLRFFLPRSKPKTIERQEILSLKGVSTRELLPFSELKLGKVAVDRTLDLLAITIGSEVQEENPPARFFDIEPGGITPVVGEEVLSMGFPHDLTRVTLKGDRVVFTYLQWSNVAPPRRLENFEPDLHFLVPFQQKEEEDAEAHPRGLSGGAMFFRKGRTPVIWSPNLDLGGVTTHFYSAPRLLKAVRREAVEDFLLREF